MKGKGGKLSCQVKSSQLPLQFSFFLPPDLAEREPYMGEFLFEGFVHVLLEVGGFDVFDDRGLKRKTNAQAVTTQTRFQHPERRPDPSNTQVLGCTATV